MSPKLIAPKIILASILILIPLTFLPKGIAISEAEISFVEVPKVFTFRLLTTLFVASVLFTTNKKSIASPVLIITVCYFIWYIVSTIFSESRGISFWGEFPAQDSYNLLATSWYFIFFVAISLSNIKPRFILECLAIAGALAFFPVILQHFHITPINITPIESGRPVGTFGNSVFAASFLLVSSLSSLIFIKRFSLSFDFRQVILLTIPLNILALILVDGRAALLALIVGIAIIVYNYDKKFSLIAVPITLIVLLSIYTITSHRLLSTFHDFSGRFRIWSTSLSLTDDRITGYGPDMFRYEYLKVSQPVGEQKLPEEPDHAHNWVLHHAVETGIIGGIFSAFLIIVPIFVVRPPFTSNTQLLLFSILIARLIEQIFGVARISDIVAFWAILGAANAEYLQNRNFTFNRSVRDYTNKLLHWCDLRWSSIKSSRTA
jgi:O-antigen ligase